MRIALWRERQSTTRPRTSTVDTREPRLDCWASNCLCRRPHSRDAHRLIAVGFHARRQPSPRSTLLDPARLATTRAASGTSQTTRA